MDAHRHVPGGDTLGEGQPHGKVGGHANLPGGQVGVRGDDGARGKVDALAHHVLPEQAFLLLQLLSDPLHTPAPQHQHTPLHRADSRNKDHIAASLDINNDTSEHAIALASRVLLRTDTARLSMSTEFVKLPSISHAVCAAQAWNAVYQNALCHFQ